MPVSEVGLSPDVETAIAIYEKRLKSALEAEHLGESVAIDADSGDFELGDSHRDAARKLKAKRPANARIVTLTIGPPTSHDIALAQRMTGR